ncbi:MAG TPA: response regulator [Burkholderiales bacterium]|nr:response regulator [Burkholderiales bacterium]
MASRTPRPLRVLVVDDERDTIMTLGILLRSEGIDVRLASGGMQVPNAVAQFRPDAVLLDLAMPDHSGLEVAQELTQCYGQRCPVLIAVTGRSTEVDRQRSASSGFRHHVAKPYDPDALLKLVLSINPR